MVVEIYYFTGTGNSLAVALEVARRMNADLVPVTSTMKKENVRTDADALGFVFPIYDFKPPKLIYELIEKFEDMDRKYIFAICTYGVMPLNTMKRLEKAIIASGGRLSGGFTIHMPHNGLGYDKIPDDRKREMYNDLNRRSRTIAEYVGSRKEGTIEKSGILKRISLIGKFIRISPRLIPMLKQGLIKGWDSLGFYTDEKCNGCGLCKRICPLNNIDMKGKRPDWGDDCMSCFACFHWCPQRSIQIANLTKKMERFHHPSVKIKDMLDQREGYNY